MERYCKNCGAALDKTTQFCPDCGREVENTPKNLIKYCHNCGEKIDLDENFCRNCGVRIQSPKVKKESFLEKNRTPIIIAATVFIIAVFCLIALLGVTPSGGQIVDVDEFYFDIPQDFILDSDSVIDEDTYGIHTSSKLWENTEDYIQIEVIYSASYDINESEVLNGLDGKQANIMGYEGKYSENTDMYEFSFVEDNKLCTVYTSNSELFDKISPVDV